MYRIKGDVMEMCRVTEIKIPHNGRVSDASVYAPECADGEKLPVVIISHGYNGCGSDHESTARALAAAGICAVTHTFCGGSTRDKSGFPTGSMTLFTECEDLEAVIDAVKKTDLADGGRIALYGESQGGLVTALTAAKRADEIAAVGLLYPAFCIPDNWRAAFPNVRDIPESVDFWGMRLGRDFFVTLRGIDVWGTVGRYGGRVLIMHGTDDRVVPLEYAERAARTYRNARLTVYEGEGHGFSHDGVRRVNAELAEFFGGTLF